MARTLPAYVTEDDIASDLPAQWFSEATDDDGDGDGEMAEPVCDSASNTVDAYLQGRYDLPISDASDIAKLTEAARIRALWLSYQRRGKHGENNPWEAEWGRWAKKLEAIEAGKMELKTSPRAAAAATTPPPKVQTNRRAMKTVSSNGLNAV